MPWMCPKCGLHVGHGDESQPLPKSGTIYRCPVCHLELAFDPVRKKMTPVTAPTDPNQSDAGLTP
jgi:hypothetical protein